MSRGNPLGTLGGLIAATQVFYLPVFIEVYQFQPSLLPLTIGLLRGAHFLPYGWLYDSRGYLFVAVATGLSALILGGPFMASSLTSVPLAIALTYAPAPYGSCARTVSSDGTRQSPVPRR